MTSRFATAVTVLAIGVLVGCGGGGGGTESPTPTTSVSVTPAMSSTPSTSMTPTPVPSVTPPSVVPLAWAVGGRTVLESEDGGLTWSLEMQAQVNAVEFVDRMVGWIAGATTAGGHLFHTTDGGLHWRDEIANAPSPSPLLFDVAVVDARHAVAVGSENGFLHPEDFHRGPPVAIVTNDAGATWQHARLEGVDPERFKEVELGSVCITATGTGLAAGTDVNTFVGTLALLTHDAGTSWMNITDRLPPVLLAKVACVGESDLWFAGGTSYLLHSADGGETWTDLSATVSSGLYIQAVRFRDPLVAWLAGDDPSHRLLALATTDGGQHWQEHVLAEGVGETGIGLDFLGQRVIVVAQDLHPSSIPRSSFGLSFTTVDGGTTWTETVHPEPIDALWDVTLVP